MSQEQFCYILRNPFGRWVVANGVKPDLAWSGSRWVLHRNGLPAKDVQVSNWQTRDGARREAERLGFAVAVRGFRADDLSITCFGCGLTSFHPEDVRKRYCGNCHVFHDQYPELADLT